MTQLFAHARMRCLRFVLVSIVMASVEKKELFVANALNSVRKSNLKGAASDEEFRTLISEYFYAADIDADIDTESSGDSDSDSESPVTGESADVNVVHSQVDVQIEDDDEVADEPIVSASDVNIVMSADAVFNTVCETKDEERTRVQSFTCKCKHFNQQPCSQQFSTEFILERRMQMNELSESKYFFFSD